MDYFQNIFSDEDGAVTVDFVVLTAAICLLGFTAVNAFGPETTRIANNISNTMTECTPLSTTGEC